MDEFVLGFRDCAKESLRYLEATGEAEQSGQRLVDELRVHLMEHEAETMRRRRRRLSDDDDELVHPATSPGYAEDRHSPRQPPRRRRRLHMTPVPMHDPLRLHHFQELHCREEIQTVYSQSRNDGGFSASSWKGTLNTSDDSGHGKELVTDTSGTPVINKTVDLAGAAGDERGPENTDELHHCASQLSNLADRDVRVRRLLTELFQLMDNDDDHY